VPAHITEGTDDRPPEWLRLALLGSPVFSALADQAMVGNSRKMPERMDVHRSALPKLALHQLGDVLETSLFANRQGRHAIGLALLRQGVEALTIVELGLWGTDRAWTLLDQWDEGRQTHGELRRVLQAESWPSYGSGLWTESWSEFMGNLARAIQPYSHFSPMLLQWQVKMVSGIEDVAGRKLIALMGGAYVDPSKRERVDLLTSLAIWALGRIVLNYAAPPSDVTARIEMQGAAIARSRWLTAGEPWQDQLCPHVWLKQ
jgi:hypothetical protein